MNRSKRRERSGTSAPAVETRKSKRERAVPHSQLVIGRRAVQELIRYRPEKIDRILAAKNAGRELTELATDARVMRIQVLDTELREITSLSGSENHQGVAAILKSRTYLELAEVVRLTEESDPSLIVVLDDIQDPQNFGSLLRAAECFGADAVVWSKNRGCDLTPSVSKAGVGASELLNLSRVSNLSEALEKLKNAGYWIVAADGEGDSDLKRFEFPARSVVILGSEGRGIQPLLLKRSDFRVRIELHGRISSLNVSQAGAIFLSAYRNSLNKEAHE